jgi:adenylate cyclase
VTTYDTETFARRLLGPADQPVGRLRVRIQVMLTVLLVSTNVIGALVVAGLSSIVVPGEGLTPPYARALMWAIPAYVVVAVVVGATLGTVTTVGSLKWALADREPTDEERRVAMRLPWRLTLVQVGLWGFAAILFPVLAAGYQPSAVLSTVFTVLIAGLVVCAIAYLFSEFVLRPIAARALQGEAEPVAAGSGVQRRMIVFWGLGTAAPVSGLVVAALVALLRNDVDVQRLAGVVLGLSAVVLLFGLLVTVLNVRAVVTPIAAVREALARVGEGDLDVEVRVDDGTELGLLQAGFNDMARGLRERDSIRDLFGRHVGHEVATAATEGRIELGGETREVSVLMVDLVGSTTYATTREPAEVVAVLNRFFTVVVEEVDRHGGLVNKFMGDAVLAIFGAPVHRDDHAALALAAARAMADRLAEEVPEIGSGIGVSTGRAVAGNVGHQSRFEYTVIGDAVNSAARLTDLAKSVDGQVLVAQASVDAAGEPETAHWQSQEPVTLRGRQETTAVARRHPS